MLLAFPLVLLYTFPPLPGTDLHTGHVLNVPHNRLTFGKEEEHAVLEVLRSGYWASGPRVEELEGTLCERAHVDHAVAVSSGLSALRLVLKGVGVGPGDEVIFPAYSCVALANAVLALGAIPVPVDVREEDWNLDPVCVRNALTKRTRAVIAVNVFGAPAPIEELQDLAVPIIEDCAHSFGMSVRGRAFGSRSTASILSFSVTKLMGAGEGGAVLTSRAELATFIRSWRHYGNKSPEPTRLHDQMTDFEAAIGLCQLQRLDAMLQARARLALRYHERLSTLAVQKGILRLPSPSEERVWYRYPIEVLSSSADEVIGFLEGKGISAVIPVVDWRQVGKGDHPVTNRAYHAVVSLPLYPTLTVEEQDRVCEALVAVFSSLSS